MTKKHSFYGILLAIMCTCALDSCTVLMEHSVSKELICPPPPTQNCYPQRYIGNSIDTSSINKERFLKIERVNGLDNTIIDEWNISFLDKDNIWTTASAGGQQVLRKIDIEQETDIKEIIPQQHEESGAIGFLTGNSQYTLAAYLPGTAFSGDAGIYLTQSKLDEITIKKEIPPSELFHWDSHPSLSPNGKILFFSSDRNNTLRGTELYVALKGEQWSKAYNCGRFINSNCDELSPFITKTGHTLLFSSSGHSTIGGYDIFSAEFNPELLEKGILADDSLMIENAFGRPQNIGSPVNTIYDELFPSSPSPRTDTLLYYSSNQYAPNQNYAFDMFVLHPAYSYDSSIFIAKADIIKSAFKRADKLDPRELITVEGKIVDEKNRKPVRGAEVTSLTYPNNEIIDQQITDTIGHYKIKVQINKPVQITAESDKLFFNTITATFSAKDSNSFITEPLTLPAILSMRINFPLGEYQKPYTYLLDSNGFETTIKWKDAIIRLASNLLKFEKNIGSVSLTGHTDDIGSDAFNMDLGKKRAKFIIQTLVKLGVPSTLLQAESEGEHVLPSKRNGESLDLFRKRCRRVELIKEIK